MQREQQLPLVPQRQDNECPLWKRTFRLNIRKGFAIKRAAQGGESGALGCYPICLFSSGSFLTPAQETKGLEGLPTCLRLIGRTPLPSQMWVCLSSDLFI